MRDDFAPVREGAIPTRRSFLAGLLAVGAAGVGALLSIPLIRFVLHPLLANTTARSWSEVGSLAEFTSLTAPVKRLVKITQLDGWRKTVQEKPIYVIRKANGAIAAVSAVCPHLGCTVPWTEREKKFVCPCHLAAFGADGALLRGPARRGLDELETKVESGTLLVQYQFFRQLTPQKEIMG
jgi:menaquinol-cytochrome c reductase iron-sulfur subunit